MFLALRIAIWLHRPFPRVIAKILHCPAELWRCYTETANRLQLFQASGCASSKMIRLDSTLDASSAVGAAPGPIMSQLDNYLRQ